MIPVVSLLASLVVLVVVLAGPGIAAKPCREHEIRIDGQAPSALSPDSSVFDVVDVVKAYVCRDEAAFSEGLLRNFGARAWHGSETSAAGIATSFGVFLRGDYLARRTLAGRVEVIAHELAHLSQQELARPRVHEVPRWIVEGHAEWAALSVVDRLGYGSYSERRAQVARSVVDGAIPATSLSGLDTLDSPDQWWRWTRSLSPSVTYGQAFLAVDRLTERYGSATMVEFFRAFARATDARECWDGLFPISYPQFVADFRTHLRSLGPAEDQGHPLGQR